MSQRTSVAFNNLAIPRHCLTNITFQIKCEIHKARDDGPLDGILAEFLLRTLVQESQKILFYHAHGLMLAYQDFAEQPDKCGLLYGAWHLSQPHKVICGGGTAAA